MFSTGGVRLLTAIRPGEEAGEWEAAAPVAAEHGWVAAVVDRGEVGGGEGAGGGGEALAVTARARRVRRSAEWRSRATRWSGGRAGPPRVPAAVQERVDGLAQVAAELDHWVACHDSPGAR